LKFSPGLTARLRVWRWQRFGVRSGEETRQMQVVGVDALVPADDDLRRIEALVD
jgi:hypothetical protein